MQMISANFRKILTMSTFVSFKVVAVSTEYEVSYDPSCCKLMVLYTVNNAAVLW